MLRSLTRALALGSLAAALFLAAPSSFARADDEPEPAPAPAPTAEPAGIQWVQGWEQGREQARKDGKLIFLYFGRHSPT